MGRRAPPTSSRLGQPPSRAWPRHMRLHRRLSRTSRPLPHRHPRRRRLAPRPRHRTQARRRRPRLHTVVQAMQPASRSMDDQPPHQCEQELVGMMKTCAQCGQQFDSSYPLRTLCSQACRWAARKARSTFTCAECGIGMWQSRTSRPQGEARCRDCQRAKSRRGAPLNACPDCGAPCWGECCRPCRSRRQVIRDEGEHTRRRQREQSAPGLRPTQRERLRQRWVKQCRRCTYCDRPATTIDHVVPLVRGGTNHEGNLAPCCRSCNARKGGRMLIEWRTGKRLPRMRGSGGSF